LIGSNPGCDLCLSDDSVSRVHSSLVLTPRGLWVVDLLGRGGVLVDGSRAKWMQVRDGTVLQIGRFRLRVRFSSSPIMTALPADNRASTGYGALLAPGAVTGGNLSEGTMLTLIGQLAEMQNQYFEQSRLQMQWMADMMAHVGRAQQESARRDLARIEEITSELKEIRVQLAGGVMRHPPAPNGGEPPHLDRPVLPVANLSEEHSHLSLLTTSPDPDVEPAANAIDLRTDESPPLPRPIQESLREQAPGPSTTSSQRSRRKPLPGSSAECLPEPLTPPPEVVARDASRPVSQPAAHARNSPPPSASSEDTHAWLTQRMAALSQEHTSLWRRLMNTLTGMPKNP
jgi:hypothetical protein